MASNIIERNNVKIYSQSRQNQGKPKPTLMFAHGFGCDQNMWRWVTPAFIHNYQIVLFDYVGSGKSDISAYSPQRYSKLEGYAQDVLDICQALDLQDLTFIGHSVSSVIGILASIQEPQLFKSLILIAPSPCYINDQSGYIGGFERQDIEDLLNLMEKNYIGWASVVAPMVMKNGDRPELSEELEASFCSSDPVIANQFARVAFLSDSRQDLPKVSISSLILQCAEDAIAPLEVGEYMHRHLPHSVLRLMQATGHCPHLSHPQEVITLIQEYLDDLQI